MSFNRPYFSTLFFAFFKSKNGAVPPRLKAIYLWERASASQEAKTREKFSLFKAGYFVWEFSAFLVTSWESFVFARSGSSESNLFVGNRLLALCASQKTIFFLHFWEILVRLLALSANTKKQKVFTWAEYLWKTENWFFLGLEQEPKPLWPWAVFLRCFKYFWNIFLFGRNNNLYIAGKALKFKLNICLWHMEQNHSLANKQCREMFFVIFVTVLKFSVIFFRQNLGLCSNRLDSQAAKIYWRILFGRLKLFSN